MKKNYLLGMILFGCLCFISPVSATAQYQVKIFRSCNNSEAEVERQINNFLKENNIHPGATIDTEISTTYSLATGNICTTVAILYQDK